MKVIGLMSGTSADGIDAVLMEIAGAPPVLDWRLIQHVSLPHPAGLKDEIFACFRPESGSVDRLCTLNFALGRVFAQASLACIEAAGMKPAEIDLIGSHGQTLWHDPAGAIPSTLQLGEPAVIAEMTGIPVVSNFRTRDVAAGGQGAPLVAYVDQLLFSHPTRNRAIQNIGGIANVTYLPAHDTPQNNRQKSTRPLADDTVLAFDTGPGNMLIDDMVRRATAGAQAYDQDGQMAAQGQLDEELLAELLAEPYLALAPPKTTGRELFGSQFGAKIWRLAQERQLSHNDIIATCSALTAFSIRDAYRQFLPHFPDEVIVSGGGARNKSLMALLQSLLHPAKVFISDDFGLQVEAKEAVAFAILAYESWHRRPGNQPSATGAKRAVVLGSITY